METITKEELATLLNGNEIGDEITNEQLVLATNSNLVVAYGASDDILVLCGSIEDEFYSTAYIDSNGKIINNDCHNQDCPCFIKRRNAGKKVDGIFDPKDSDLSWVITTEIPHSKFIIMEDGEPFCEGLVFSLNDLG